MLRLHEPHRARVIILLLSVFAVAGCGPSEKDIKRMKQLARVKKVAPVCFVGKSRVNPNGELHKELTRQMYAAFEDKAKETASEIQFIPCGRVSLRGNRSRLRKQ